MPGLSRLKYLNLDLPVLCKVSMRFSVRLGNAALLDAWQPVTYITMSALQHP